MKCIHNRVSFATHEGQALIHPRAGEGASSLPLQCSGDNAPSAEVSLYSSDASNVVAQIFFQ